MARMSWLTPVGILFEMLGLVLAATEYLGPERFERIEKKLRGQLRLSKTPDEYERTFSEVDSPISMWNEKLLDMAAYTISALGGVLLIALCLAPFAIIFSPEQLGQAANQFTVVYYSLLPPLVWGWAFFIGLVGSVALHKAAKRHAWAKVLRGVAASMFVLAGAPVLIPLAIAGRIYAFGAVRNYRAVHHLVSRASESWDKTKARQGNPMLLLGIICGGIGLTLELLDSV